MKRMTIILLVAALFGCTAPPATPKVAAQQQAALKHQYSECLINGVTTLDDRVSDAHTIAIAVAAVCYPQYHAFAKSYADNLQNSEQTNIFMRTAESDPSRVDGIVPMILMERKQQLK